MSGDMEVTGLRSFDHSIVARISPSGPYDTPYTLVNLHLLTKVLGRIIYWTRLFRKE